MRFGSQPSGKPLSPSPVSAPEPECAEKLRTIVSKLWALFEDQDLFSRMMETARANQQAEEQMEERFQRALSETAANPDPEAVEREIALRRELYGGFSAEEESADFHYQYGYIFILPEDLDAYNNDIAFLARKYKRKTPQEVIETGGEKLLEVADIAIDRLRTALSRGQKLQANACVDILRYILVKGLENETLTDPGARDQVVEGKHRFVFETGIGLLNAVEKYYELLNNLQIQEKEYTPAKKMLGEDLQQLRAIPDDVREILGRLGFKNGMKQLPKNAATDDIVRLVMRVRSEYTKVRLLSLAISRNKMFLDQLRQDIHTLIMECRMAFGRSGQVFDYASHHKALHSITLGILGEAREAAHFATETQRLNEEVNSMASAVENDASMGQTIAGAMRQVSEYAEQQTRTRREETSPLTN